MAKVQLEVSVSSPRTFKTGRPSRLLRAPAVGAIAGQLSQALASFVLQILAARALGAEGLGLFALILSVLVMVAAVSSGLVGDTLTILDRQDKPVRSGLQQVSVYASVVGGTVAVLAAWLTKTLDGAQSLLFGAALVVFLLEDVLRRLLMASMRFWSLVFVDATSLVVYLVTLGVAAAVGSLSITTFLLALLLGQVFAGLVAVVILPSGDRWFAPWRPAALSQVGRFGGWRGLQQSVRPTMLTVARVLITLAVGRAAFGELEAARVYMAPAILVVQGMGTYLMSSYARRKDVPLANMLHRADRMSLLMLAAALALGAAATPLVPWLGPQITGSTYSMSSVAVLGWAVYAASTAALMPFASLAAVRGKQSLIVGLRVVDSLLSLLFLTCLMLLLQADASWSPYALAAGSFIGGWLIRARVLKPLVRAEARS